MSSLTESLVIFGVPMLLLSIGVVAGAYLGSRVQSLRAFLFPNQIIAEQKYMIVTGVQELGHLVTVQYKVASTNINVEIHHGFLDAGFYSANHEAFGVIEAGIEFAALRENSVRFHNDAYTVTLPAPIVTSCRIEHIEQNRHSFTLLAADWNMVRQIAQAEALEQFAQEMIEVGILERAAEEAALRIGDFVRNLTGSPATIEFADRSGELELPCSCKPIVPTGWVKDENGGWRRADS